VESPSPALVGRVLLRLTASCRGKVVGFHDGDSINVLTDGKVKLNLGWKALMRQRLRGVGQKP